MQIALDTLHNLSQRGVLVFQRSHQKTGLVLFDPSRHTIEDFGLAQMLPGDPQCLGGQVGGMARRVLRKRPVLVRGKAGLGRHDGPTAPQEVLGLMDSAPAQVIEQFARNPLQQSRVRVAQKLEHNAPLPLRGRGGIRRCPALECGSQPPLRDRACDALGNRLNQLALFFEKRPFVRPRHLSPVGNFDRSNRLSLRDNAGLLNPRRSLEIRRLDCQVLKDDPCLTVGWVLPAWR